MHVYVHVMCARICTYPPTFCTSADKPLIIASILFLLSLLFLPFLLSLLALDLADTHGNSAESLQFRAKAANTLLLRSYSVAAQRSFNVYLHSYLGGYRSSLSFLLRPMRL